MGKTEIKYNGIVFDSKEELYFYQYLEQLKDNGYIDTFYYNTSASFVLSEPILYEWNKATNKKSIIQKSTLLEKHSYTPDFYIEWNTKSHGIFYLNIDDCIKLDKIPFITQKNNSWIEIKPNWDFKNMTRLVTLNIKWIYQKYNIYVQKIIPIGNSKCLFANTFVPEKAKFTEKKKQLKKFKFEPKSLEEFINESKCII